MTRLDPPSDAAFNASGDEARSPRATLSLFDAISMIVGIVIGVGIFQSTPIVAQHVTGMGSLYLCWLFGGIFSLCGALCSAELASAFPNEGGDYVYLSKSFGRPVAFLLAWCEFWIVRPGSIGAMAFVMANYASQMFPEFWRSRAAWLLAPVAIVAVTAINATGVRAGSRTQNLLTATKVLALLGVFAASLAVKSTSPAGDALNELSTSSVGFLHAMVFVMFAYGGWNDMCYAAAEVREPRRNLGRALIWGTVSITIIYLATTSAFVRTLGFARIRESNAVAAETLDRLLADWGAIAMSLLIVISCLGAINGMIFTGARIYYALGTEHPWFAWVGKWHAGLGVPLRSLVLQGAVTVTLVILFGWYEDGFGHFVVFTAWIFWGFRALVCASIFVLRARPDYHPSYRVPGFPVIPIVFCVTCCAMVYSALVFAVQQRHWEAFWSLGVLLVGAIVALLPSTRKTAPR